MRACRTCSVLFSSVNNGGIEFYACLQNLFCILFIAGENSMRNFGGTAL